MQINTFSLIHIFLPFLLAYIDKWELYKQFFEESPIALTVVEENGLISYTNKKFAELVGYKLHEIIGEHFTKFVAPEDRKRMEEYHIKRIKGEEAPSEYEYRCLRKDGETRYVRIKVIKLPENRTLSCKIDITEERKAKEMENVFERMANSTAVILFIYQDDYFVYVNPAMEKLTGYSKEELLKMHFWDIIKENYKEIVKEIGRERQIGKEVKPAVCEIPFYDKNGNLKWALCSFTNISYKGKPAGLGTAIDITEKKKTEEELKEREKRFKFLYQHSPSLNLIIGFDGRILDANDTFLELTGYRREEVIGKNTIDFVVEEQREKVWKQLQMDLKELKTPSIEVDIVGKEKIHTIFFGEGSVTIYEKGKPIGVLISGIDITERKAMEKALKESQEKYKMLVELSQEGICIDDENEKMVFTNDAFAKILGYKKEELLGKKVFDILYPEDKEKFMKEIEKRRKGEIGRYEVRFIAKNGEIKTFIVSAIPLYKNGKFIGSLSVNLDITERKLAEEKLAESEALYRAIAEYSQSGIFILQDERFKFVNSKFIESVGYREEELKKMNYLDLIHKEDKEKIKIAIEEIMKGRKIDVPEFRYITKDKKIRWAVGTGTSIEYKGKPAFLGVMTDITKIKEIHEKEKKFIENISHYFFNPICIARGYIDLVKNRINGEDKRMLEKAEDAILRIENVVKNIIRKGEIHE